MSSSASVFLTYLFAVGAAVGPTAPPPPADISLEDALADMRRTVGECRKLATDPDGRSYAHECVTLCEQDIAGLPAREAKWRARDVQRCRTKLLLARDAEAQRSLVATQKAQQAQRKTQAPAAEKTPTSVPKPAVDVASPPSTKPTVKYTTTAPVPATDKPAGAGGILRRLGYEAENPLFDLVFHGLYPKGDSMATRSMLMIYAEYSDQYCRQDTPNGARESTWTWTSETRNLYGVVYNRNTTTHTTWVDNKLVGTFESYRFSLPPEARLQNTGSLEETMSVMMRSYEPALAARRDMEKLFATGCKSRHVRQMNENLARMVRSQPSLQDDLDESLPLPFVVQEACEASLAAPKGESSGYRLKSCACMAEQVGRKLVRADKFVLRANFNSLQLALIGYQYQTPGLVQQCLIRDTRPGAGNMLPMVERPAASPAPGSTPAATDPDAECLQVMNAARDGVLSPDWCGATRADMQRAVGEMKKVVASAVCNGRRSGEAALYIVEDTVQQRCKVQSSGTPSEEEARLAERIAPGRGCLPLADPKVESYVRSAMQSMSRDDVVRRLKIIGPMVPREDSSRVTAKACAGMYLIGKWSGG